MEITDFGNEPIKVYKNWMVIYLKTEGELAPFFILEEDWRNYKDNWELKEKVLGGELFWTMFNNNIAKVEEFKLFNEINVSHEVNETIELLKTIWEECYSEKPDLLTENWRESVSTRLKMAKGIIDKIEHQFDLTFELQQRLRIANREHTQLIKHTV